MRPVDQDGRIDRRALMDNDQFTRERVRQYNTGGFVQASFGTVEMPNFPPVASGSAFNGAKYPYLPGQQLTSVQLGNPSLQLQLDPNNQIYNTGAPGEYTIDNTGTILQAKTPGYFAVGAFIILAPSFSAPTSLAQLSLGMPIGGLIAAAEVVLTVLLTNQYCIVSDEVGYTFSAGVRANLQWFPGPAGPGTFTLQVLGGHVWISRRGNLS